jgi:hypothetical protein
MDDGGSGLGSAREDGARRRRASALHRAPWPASMRRLWRLPNLFLLLALVVQVLAYPFLQDRPHGRAGIAVIDWVILALALRAARATGVEIRLGYILLVPAMGLHVTAAMWPGSGLYVASLVAQCAFHTFVAICLLRYMLRDRIMTLDELYAAAALYALIAFAFSYLYAAIEALAPASFFINPQNNPDGIVSWWELLYFSFTCLTSVGSGEITPVSDHVRGLVMLQQTMGVLFLAIVISRLITMHAWRRGE